MIKFLHMLRHQNNNRQNNKQIQIALIQKLTTLWYRKKTE